jgi:hypothetical protein
VTLVAGSALCQKELCRRLLLLLLQQQQYLA